MAKPKDIYIIAQYAMRPRPGVNTSQPGWHGVEGNVVWDEKILVTHGVKNSHKNSQVIVNVTKRKVERNSISKDGTVPNFWLTWNYFIKHNGKYIKDAMDFIDDRAYNDVVAEIELMMHLAKKQEEQDKEKSEET